MSILPAHSAWTDVSTRRRVKTQCPKCGATFEFDDRAECIFSDTENLKLPATGNICAFCGLIQIDQNQNCLYCGIKIRTAVH